MFALPLESLEVLTWVFTAAATLLTVGRFIIRKRVLKAAFGWDDVLQLFACLILIVFSAVYNAYFHDAYDAFAFTLGTRPDLPGSEWDQYFRYEVTVSLLFWIIIYAVKLSFLMFYRSLFQLSETFMKFWWAVLALTFVTFGACFISLFWGCGTPGVLFNVASCTDPMPNAIPNVVKVSCILNVFSDFTIMLLPLWMIKDMTMPISQKIGLAAVFCLASLDVIFDILRTIYTDQKLSPSFNLVWDLLEPSIAVIVCALPIYRSLFSNSRRREAKITSSYLNPTANGRSLPGPQGLHHGLMTFQSPDKVDSSKDPNYRETTEIV